eukprot:2050584-Amphidinium_carterae.2
MSKCRFIKGLHRLFLAHDLAAWSESESQEHLKAYEQQNMGYCEGSSSFWAAFCSRAGTIERQAEQQSLKKTLYVAQFGFLTFSCIVRQRFMSGMMRVLCYCLTDTVKNYNYSSRRRSRLCSWTTCMSMNDLSAALTS